MNKIEKVRALLRLAACESEKPEGQEARKLAERMIERYDIRPSELGEERQIWHPHLLPPAKPAYRFQDEPWTLHFEMRLSPPAEAWRRLLMYALAQRMNLEMRIFSCVILRSKESSTFERWQHLYQTLEHRLLEAVKGLRQHERDPRCERIVRHIEHQIQHLPEEQLSRVKITDIPQEPRSSAPLRVRWA
ncbi:hypothetical protein L6R29_22660 [Myxococcota bacterium]|nr:hypothetical protein [Myxococcota bacterium]